MLDLYIYSTLFYFSYTVYSFRFPGSFIFHDLFNPAMCLGDTGVEGMRWTRVCGPKAYLQTAKNAYENFCQHNPDSAPIASTAAKVRAAYDGWINAAE